MMRLHSRMARSEPEHPQSASDPDAVALTLSTASIRHLRLRCRAAARNGEQAPEFCHNSPGRCQHIALAHILVVHRSPMRGKLPLSAGLTEVPRLDAYETVRKHRPGSAAKEQFGAMNLFARNLQ